MSLVIKLDENTFYSIDDIISIADKKIFVIGCVFLWKYILIITDTNNPVKHCLDSLWNMLDT